MFSTFFQSYAPSLTITWFLFPTISFPQTKCHDHYHNSDEVSSHLIRASRYELIKTLSNATLKKACNQLKNQFFYTNSESAATSIDKGARKLCRIGIPIKTQTFDPRKTMELKAFNVYVNTTNGFFITNNFEKVEDLIWIFAFRCDVRYSLTFCVMMQHVSTSKYWDLEFVREGICPDDLKNQIDNGVSWVHNVHTCDAEEPKSESAGNLPLQTGKNFQKTCQSFWSIFKINDFFEVSSTMQSDVVGKISVCSI